MTKEIIDVRQHILNCARPIILQKGFTAAGLSEILKSAKTPKGSFYYYFQSKEALGVALIEDYFKQYCLVLEENFQCTTKTPTEKLTEYWQGWIQNYSETKTDNQCLSVKLSGEVSDLSDDMRHALQQGTHDTLKLITDCLQEGFDSKDLRNVLSTPELAQTLYSLWLGATLQVKIEHSLTPLHNAYRMSLTMLGISQ